MNPKFIVLYLVFGALGLLLAGYKLVTTYPNVSIGRTVLDVIVGLFFFYLAYKAYHVKKDKELM
jgi:hypothetical protein